MAEPRVLAGRYQIDSLLGRGGMAQVYLGTDRVLGRHVAVKVLGRQYAQDSSFVNRFRREAQSAAALNHPNVVSVFDTGSDDGGERDCVRSAVLDGQVAVGASRVRVIAIDRYVVGAVKLDDTKAGRRVTRDR